MYGHLYGEGYESIRTHQRLSLPKSVPVSRLPPPATSTPTDSDPDLEPVENTITLHTDHTSREFY